MVTSGLLLVVSPPRAGRLLGMHLRLYQASDPGPV